MANFRYCVKILFVEIIQFYYLAENLFVMGWEFIIEMNRKIVQNRELKKNATKSRLSREPVKYKKSGSEQIELTPEEKAIQQKRLAEYRSYIKKRERIVLVFSILIITAVLFLFFFYSFGSY